MFNLNPNINPNKIFIINRSDLDIRFDPIYYNIVNSLTIVKETSFPVKKLSEVINMQRGRFGHRPRNDPKFYNGQYPFIQTGDIVKASNKGGRIKYSQTLNELGLGTSRLFQPGVMIITIAANIGDTAILDYPACFPDSLIAISPKDKNELDINYLNVYFKFLKKYLNDLAPQAAQKNINYQQLAPTPIIIPDNETQSKIVDIYQSAVKLKKLKEAQAKQLLQGVDSYLLTELGIILPKKDSSLTNRIFKTSFKEISGGRLDPKLYDNTTVGLKNAIKNVNSSKYKVEPLKKFVTQSIAGDWGIDEIEEYDEDLIKCLVIRATEFDNSFNLKLENSRVKYILIKKDKLEKIDIRENDLLIEKSGGSIDQPVGRIAIITKEILNDNSICYSNFIHKIRIDETKLNTQYLYYYLKTIHNSKLTESMQSQTNGIRNLIMATYLNQTIVLPINQDGSFDLTKQTEIANHIEDIRSQAKKLQEEAKEVLEDAKKEVEKMILGNKI